MDFRFQDYLTTPLTLLKLRREMACAPFQSAEEAGAKALRKLREICFFAQKTIPYYRDLFARQGFDPAKLEDFDAWRALPTLDKDAVRANLEHLQSSEMRRLGAVWCETSGSTGTAMRFLLDRAVNTATFALFWRAWGTAPGWRLGKRQAMISGYAEGKWSYKRKTRILALSSFHLTPETAAEFHELLMKYQPAFLRGYPSSLYLFARLLEEQGLKLHYPVLFSGAETLLPFQREAIERFFGGKVIDHYTHWERTASIRECLHGRLHAENDYGWHEILRPDGSPCEPGETGRLVCTGLFNKAMPLLRYDTRDLAAWAVDQACPCGSHFPIIERIEGRIEDVVATPEGRLVGRLDAAFKFTPAVRLAQLFQPARECVIVKLVVDQGWDAEQRETLLRELRKRLGERIEIELRLVEDGEIERTPRGKVRFVVSQVPAAEKLGHD